MKCTYGERKMKRVTVNLLAWIGIGFIAGAVYWIGYFNGGKAHAKHMHTACQKVFLLTFKDDNTPYLCTPPPQQRQPRGPIQHDTI